MVNIREARPVFEYDDYKKYLRDALPVSGDRRGLRSRLARELRCQTSFISRVLSGPADFSAEHAVVISRFLEHTEDEADFLLLLVQSARAGTRELREHWGKKMQEHRRRRRREQVRERIQVRQGLTLESQATYYSAWYYAAIHILLTVPGFQAPATIARHLALPLPLVSECLEFLVTAGLAARDGAQYRPGTARIHLGNDSPMIARHHANWRMRAIQALDRRPREDLFFSGPIGISEEDGARIRSELLGLLERIEPVIRASKEEAVFCLGMDFFRV